MNVSFLLYTTLADHQLRPQVHSDNVWHPRFYHLAPLAACCRCHSSFQLTIVQSLLHCLRLPLALLFVVQHCALLGYSRLSTSNFKCVFWVLRTSRLTHLHWSCHEQNVHYSTTTPPHHLALQKRHIGINIIICYIISYFDMDTVIGPQRYDRCALWNIICMMCRSTCRVSKDV